VDSHGPKGPTCPNLAGGGGIHKGGTMNKKASSTLRIYFDPEADVDFNDSVVMDTLANRAYDTLRRAKQTEFDWGDVEVDVYYYPGGIEDSPKHGKYQRGAGFYADISITM